MKLLNLYLLLLLLFTSSGCKKDFLDAKPSTNLVTPVTLADYQAMLENVDILNRATPGLLQLACDDYIFIDNSAWVNAYSTAEHTSYTWAKDLYEGQNDIKDWNTGYSGIFICNSVIEGLGKIQSSPANQAEWKNLKGWAYFMRAYLLYDLVRSFSPAYDSQTASSDLGVPIRLKSAIDENQPRPTVEKTYHQIFLDLAEAEQLLMPDVVLTHKEQPSKVAVTALAARIYLSMRKYDKAEQNANSTLAAYPALIDYNTVDVAQRIPFTMNNAETILNTTVIKNYYNVIAVGGFIDAVTVEPVLYQMYTAGDLRKEIYFGTNPLTGSIYMKFGYAGAYVNSFTGLATDEMYLIKAECLARRNQVSDALRVINTLLINRYKTGEFIPLSATNETEALSKILVERRKELIWRSLRWTDLKRLNKEGANITLKREINGNIYILPPNDPKYVFPIPDDEIALSGIQQNIR
jgi:hypothetical protein